MKTLLFCAVALFLISCNDNPTKIIVPSSVIRVHVFYDVGLGGMPVILMQKSDTVRTDTNGLAWFHVMPGRYVVKVLGVNRGGPIGTFLDTVNTHSGDTEKIEVFDCLPCVIADTQNTDIQFGLIPSSSQGSPQNPLSLNFQIVNTGTTPKFCGDGCSYSPISGVYYEIYGPDSKVFYQPPRRLCPDHIILLHGGGEFSAHLSFNDIVNNQSLTNQTAQPGMYTVVANFTYWSEGENGTITLSRMATFKWKDK